LLAVHRVTMWRRRHRQEPHRSRRLNVAALTIATALNITTA
jgi:hypothetical protein